MNFNLEDENLEFKQEFTKDIRKEVIAFANAYGGTIYIGIDKKGNYYPIENIDTTMQQVTNTIRDSISPDVTFFVRYEIEDKKIIKITVSEGTNKPYFLNKKGLTPSGVYIRQGNTNAPASRELIRRMIKLTDGNNFEDERTLNQELTFKSAEEEFASRNVEFKENNRISLGIKNKDKLYTNLGVLLSDQCEHTIKVAVFSGTNKTSFKDRKEFGGSLFDQLKDTYNFLQLNNKLPAVIVGLDRIERFDYPADSVREALLNAIIHRDYSYSGSIIINIYDDRMEFVSIGGLAPGIGEDELFTGVSQPRNKKLAAVFYRLKHVETYATGLQNIMERYKKLDVKPYASTTPNSFILTIPNQNYKNPLLPTTLETNAQQNEILKFLNKNKTIINSDIQKLLNVKQARAARILKEMINLKLILHGVKRGEYTANL